MQQIKQKVKLLPHSVTVFIERGDGQIVLCGLRPRDREYNPL